MRAQNLAARKTGGVGDVRLEVDVRGEHLAGARCAQGGGIEGGLEEDEWQVGVVIGGGVGHDGGDRVAALEGGVVGVKEGEEAGNAEGRSVTGDIFTDFAGGRSRGIDTPRPVIGLGTCGSAHGQERVKDVVDFDNIAVRAGGQFGRTRGEEVRELGANAAFWASSINSRRAQARQS